MLTIKNVSAVIDTKDLLKNISLNINSGEIHAILGPKKSGKSSLAHLIAGHPSIIQTEGSITFKKKNMKYSSSRYDGFDEKCVKKKESFSALPVSL